MYKNDYALNIIINSEIKKQYIEEYTVYLNFTTFNTDIINF